MYKNCIKQSPGFIGDNLEWMMQEAQKLGYDFGSCDRVGGIAVDEMSIQVLLISSEYILKLMNTVKILVHLQ